MRLVAVQDSGVVFAIGALGGVVSEAGVKIVKQGKEWCNRKLGHRCKMIEYVMIQLKMATFQCVIAILKCCYRCYVMKSFG